MNVSGETLLILAGLAINALAVVGGFWKFSLSYEKRMTTMETKLEFIETSLAHIPKRHGDSV